MPTKPHPRPQLALDASPEVVTACRAVESRLEATFTESGGGDAWVTDRFETAAEALRTGIPVLLAKPWTLDASQRAELGATAGALCMPAHAWRFAPSIRAMQAALASGKLGDAGLLRVHRWCGEDAACETKTMADLDLAMWLFGLEPEQVFIVHRPDYLQIHLGFAGGGMALVDHFRRLPAGQSYESVSLIGSCGAAYADDHHDTQLLFAGERPAALLTGHARTDLVAMLNAFLGTVAEGRAPSVTLADTSRAMSLVTLIETAAGTGLGSKLVLDRRERVAAP